jgi:hypothetical protein
MKLATLSVAVVALLLVSTASALPVRVRGGARLQAQARFVGEGQSVLELRGRLSDDSLAPIANAWVELQTSSALALGDAGGCRQPRVSVSATKEGLRVQTAAGGELCLRWTETPGRGKLAMRFGGDSYHGGAELELSFDRTGPQKLATTLRFEPRPLAIDLDKEKTDLSVLLDLALSTAHASRDGLQVELFDERNGKIATGRSSGDGKVRLELLSSKLAGPGMGSLHARFAGNADLEASHDEQPITRRVSVALSLDGELDAVDAGDNAEIAIVVSAKRGLVANGVVEALFNGSSVGSASVEDGRALLLVPVDPKLEGEMSLTLRYLPASPWYRPGPTMTVVLPIAPPSVLLRVLLTLVVLAAAGWVTVSWRRAHKLPPLGAGTPMLTPGVHVIQSRRGTKSWSGTVVDAHDAKALPDVTITVREATLEGDGVLIEAVTDRYGKFAFDLDQRPEAAELLASSASHSEARRALPAGGTLRIALITRRRAVLRRFVSWARIRGKPYDSKPEPTPAHVQTAAGDRQDVQLWAGQVEEAAFGPSPVDEPLETQLREKEPGP